MKNLTELTKELNHLFTNNLKNSVRRAADRSFWLLKRKETKDEYLGAASCTTQVTCSARLVGAEEGPEESAQV